MGGMGGMDFCGRLAVAGGEREQNGEKGGGLHSVSLVFTRL
jgi:hypothetical protein